MPEVVNDAVDMILGEGDLGRVLFAGLFDLRHDGPQGAQPCQIAGLAFAGCEVGRFGQVIEDGLGLFPFRHTRLALPHAVVFDVRVQGGLGRLACVVLDVLVVQNEALFQAGVIIVQVILFPLGIVAVPFPGKDLFLRRFPGRILFLF